MSAVPERISVKRRRDDDAVDTLVLQHDKDNKRRATEHVYRRVRQDIPRIDPKTAGAAGRDRPSETPKNGIPTVRATNPGDELRPYAQPDATLPRSADRTKRPAEPCAREEGQNKRQFRLTRELSLSSRDAASPRGNKPRSLLRPHLPTFVERNEEHVRYDASFHLVQPKDRIVPRPQNHKDTATDLELKLQSGPGNQPGTVTELRPFVQSQKARPKTGRSIRDSPNIWDFESDQLADELAALAVEMDPSMVPQNHPLSEAPELSPPKDTGLMVVDVTEDFVFETYVRVIGELDKQIEIDSTVGYLVIDEDDEELWNQYINEEDDDSDEWNEEDEDSNAEDNPRNDYPEDDWSSDDGLDRAIYRHRRHGSDDEEFDQEHDG